MFSANSSQVSDEKLYVEDVFSTYLFNGQGGATDYNVINGIDLAGKGGLVWSKYRTTTASNWFIDTARGALQAIAADTTDAQFTAFQNMTTGFLSNGFTFRDSASGFPLASWTFRKAPKFFDVVTYTGNGVAGRQIAHSLGVAPGCIIVKQTDTTRNWRVYHRSLGADGMLALNLTDANTTGSFWWNNTSPTSTHFTLGTDTATNEPGGTYVAYLFAHDTTSDGIIQCGSFTHTNGSSTNVSLGWEPQWLLMKRSDAVNNWVLLDNMRGMPVDGADAYLYANTSGAEASTTFVDPSATGFATQTSLNSGTYIYIAIRRGPMRTPTSGTSVFDVQTYTGDSSFNRMISTSTPAFPVDLAISRDRNTADIYWYWSDRLRGKDNSLYSNSDTYEDNGPYPYTAAVKFDLQTGLYASGIANNDSGKSFVAYSFRRAASFFDITCYTGTGSNTTVSHNLRATPELIIVKRRNSSGQWGVYTAGGGATKYLRLDQADGEYVDATYWNNVAPTSSVFTIGTNTNVNSSGGSYVAYLFASAPGVSKVGTYTGNGTSQTIDCGFAAGARFVMIKRRDSNGAWYVFDTARGIVAGNDPSLTFNTANSETTSSDAIDTNSTGFVVNSTGGIINISGATYLYLAVA